MLGTNCFMAMYSSSMWRMNRAAGPLKGGINKNCVHLNNSVDFPKI